MTIASTELKMQPKPLTSKNNGGWPQMLTVFEIFEDLP
jgi:hypothetical protein